MKTSNKGFIVPLLLGVIVLLVTSGGIYVYQNKKTETPVIIYDTEQVTQVQQEANNTTPSTGISNWKTYTNAEYGIELKYPPTWKVQEKVTGYGFWINPPDFKMPESGTVNPYFSFDRTAHVYQGDEKPVIKEFGTRTGYVYVKDQSVYFPEANVAGGDFIHLYTPQGIDEPNQILSTFKFTKLITNSVTTSVSLDMTNQYAKTYKTIFTTEFAKEANLDGHFRVVGVGCGTSCISIFALDKNNGRVYEVAGATDYSLLGNQIRTVDGNGQTIIYIFNPLQDKFQGQAV